MTNDLILALPTGHTSRPPTTQDAKAAWSVVAARDTAVIGRPDMTVDDVRDIIEDPEADAEHDALLVHDATGAPVGFAFVIPKGDSDLVDMDLYVDPDADPALTLALLARCERRAAEQGRARGHAFVHVDKGTHRQDAAMKQLLGERGYAVATTFHRMRLELDGSLPAPATLDGFALEQVAADDEQGLRAAHSVKEAAFTRHFGSVAQTYEEWRTFLAGRSDVDLSQLWLVRASDGEPVAMLLGTDAFVADENAGYVLTVATAPGYRGKGLARALLLTAFAEMRRRGRVAALLHVDAANVTDALGLYESVGMRPVIQIDILRRTLPTGLGASEPLDR